MVMYKVATMKGHEEVVVEDDTVSYSFEDERVPKTCRESFDRACELLSAVFRAGRRLYLCGNGGSAADAEHIVGELMKGFLLARRLPEGEQSRLVALWGSGDGALLAERLQGGLPAIALGGALSLNTAVANDVSAELVYAQSIHVLGREGDALLAISTSGNARNVTLCAKAAKAAGLFVIGLTGPHGGELAPLCDVAIKAPGQKTHLVQEIHIRLYHELCARLELEFFDTCRHAP